MPRVHETVINFDIFEGSNEYYGFAEATLPSVVNKLITASGAGIAGDVEVPVIGHIDPMSMTLNFRTFMPECARLAEQRPHTLELRAAQQSRDSATGAVTVSAVKHIAIVIPKSLNPGTLRPASAADASGEYSVTYFASYIDGVKVLEVDPLNFIYNVNGTDYLSEVRTALGK